MVEDKCVKRKETRKVDIMLPGKEVWCTRSCAAMVEDMCVKKTSTTKVEKRLPGKGNSGVEGSGLGRTRSWAAMVEDICVKPFRSMITIETSG